LFSNASRNIYKDNKLSAFTVKLAQPIGLGSKEKWEVGVCEISSTTPAVGTVKSVLIVGETFFVCCNLISLQFVGDNVRCL